MGTARGLTVDMNHSYMVHDIRREERYHKVNEAEASLYPEKPTHKYNRSVRTAASPLLSQPCLALALGTLAIVMSTGCCIYLALSRPTIQKVYADNSLCVPCAMIGGSSEASAYNIDGYPICCFDDHHGNGKMAETLELVKLEDKKGIRKNSCHVYYSEPRNNRDPRGVRMLSVTPRKLTSWATKGSRIHIGEGIQYDDTSGRFTATVAGNYMMYSHMAFQPAPHVLNEYEAKGHNLTFLFSHNVRVESSDSAEDDVIVMEDSAEATCLTRRKYGGQLYPCHVSNLVGMMPLVEGDMLSVEVAPSEFLLGELKSSYFGLFLMG